MQTIPQGLRWAYLVSFVVALVFGVAGVFAPRLVGDLAGHPVRDIDVNMGLGSAALAFAAGSYYGLRATRWEQVSLVTFVLVVFDLVGGVGGFLTYIMPGLVGVENPPAVQLLVAVILLALGLVFAAYYVAINGFRSPLATSAAQE